jgi:hypothetical protein
MAYSKAKLKSSGDKASPCFRPFWIGKLSDKCSPIFSTHGQIKIHAKYLSENLKRMNNMGGAGTQYCSRS